MNPDEYFAVRREHLPEIRRVSFQKGYNRGFVWGAFFSGVITLACTLLIQAVL